MLEAAQHCLHTDGLFPNQPLHLATIFNLQLRYFAIDKLLRQTDNLVY